jgi:hypothetical protein
MNKNWKILFYQNNFEKYKLKEREAMLESYNNTKIGSTYARVNS